MTAPNVEQSTFGGLAPGGAYAATLGENSFARVHPSTGNFVQQFSSYHFEAFTLGLQPHLEVLDPSSATQIETLRTTLQTIKRDPDFQRIAKSGGKNFAIPLGERIEFVSTRVGQALGQ